MTKKSFLSVFTLFILTLQLQWNVPGKYYSTELIEQQDINTEWAEEGVIAEYGFQAVDLLGLMLLFLLLRPHLFTILDEFTFSKKTKNESLSLNIFDKIILFSWCVYFSFSFFGSVFNSFHPFFSVVNGVSLFKVFPAYLGIRFGFLHTQKHLLWLFLGVLIFQSAVVSGQMVKGIFSTIDNSRLTRSYIIPEEFGIFPRPSGTFFYWNELSLLSCVIGGVFLILFYSGYSKNKKLGLLGFVCSGIAVVMSQTRTIWLLLLIFLLGWVIMRRTFFLDIWKSWSRRAQLYAVAAICVALSIALPRILLSQFILSDTGGLNLRKEMIEEGVQVIWESPLAGNGFETNLQITQEMFPDGYVSYFPFPIHSTYITTAIDSGIIGATFLWLPFIFILRKAWVVFEQRKTFFNYSLASLLSIPLLFYLVHNMIAKVELPFLGLLLGALVYYYTSDEHSSLTTTV